MSPAGEEAWWWALLHLSKAWDLLEEGRQEPWGRGKRLSSVTDDHCNLLAWGSQGAEYGAQRL